VADSEEEVASPSELVAYEPTEGWEKTRETEDKCLSDRPLICHDMANLFTHNKNKQK